MAREIKAKDITLAKSTGEQRSVFATWKYTNAKVKKIGDDGKVVKKNGKVVYINATEKFSYEWGYMANSTWFAASTGSTADHTSPKSATYSYPENATQVRFRVKAISKTYKYKKDGKGSQKTGTYFSTTWSDWQTKKVKDSVLPDDPSSAPQVELQNKTQIKSYYDVYDTNVTGKKPEDSVQFELYNSITSRKVQSIAAPIAAKRASVVFNGSAGQKYKVRCRVINAHGKSKWSQFSSDVETGAGVPVGFTARGTGPNTITVYWSTVINATEGYEIEYAKDRTYFDRSDSVQTATAPKGLTSRLIEGLEQNTPYFFRMRAKNSAGESGWTQIIGPVKVGSKPAPPTTWSSTTVCTAGDKVTLYWTHNTEDGSKERAAKIHGIAAQDITVDNPAYDETSIEEAETRSYVLDTGPWTEGATIRWKVATRGVIDEYSGWSAERSIDVYAKPYLYLTLGIENKWYWDEFNFLTGDIYATPGDVTPLGTDSILSRLPIYMVLESGPLNERPISYSIIITSNDTYSDIDELGNVIYVQAGSEVYSKHFDIDPELDQHKLFWSIQANDINLYNGITYTVTATVAMDVGLSAEAAMEFHVSWDEDDSDYVLDAEIVYDPDSASTFISPYMVYAVATDDSVDEEEIDEDVEETVDDMRLSVYRIESDGRFVSIAENLQNNDRAFAIDPHPTLGHVSYRFVAKSLTTGRLYFSDYLNYPIPETAIIIQWDEEWRVFDGGEAVVEDDLAEQPAVGSFLRLPYNIDVQDKSDVDVSFVNYIGRSHPVSYYGTQLGQTATWNTDIPTSDTETIFKLRRLQHYLGNAYVREPSGVGYWAQVKPEFKITHCKVITPVTLSITRVEGGV